MLTDEPVARDSKFSQGANELRHPSAQLPLDRLRHIPAGQGESEYIDTEW